jgi:hypothetical protein
VNIIAVSLLFVSIGYCASEEIDSKFGEAPVIDGYIDFSSNEWNKAVKKSTYLEDLPIEFWVIHDYSNLYISVQIELEVDAHNVTEFVGILISNSSSENLDDFVDTKIVQFSDISENNFTYLDYYINNSVFLPDVDNHGNGAARLEGKTSTYEFSIPTNIVNQEDVLLDHGNEYAFNISYGDIPSYPTGIIKSTIILINIKSIATTEQPLWDLIFFVLIIIIFSSLGILFGFYIYKIFKLREKIERIKR